MTRGRSTHMNSGHNKHYAFYLEICFRTESQKAAHLRSAAPLSVRGKRAFTTGVKAPETTFPARERDSEALGITKPEHTESEHPRVKAMDVRLRLEFSLENSIVK